MPDPFMPGAALIGPHTPADSVAEGEFGVEDLLSSAGPDNDPISLDAEFAEPKPRETEPPVKVTDRRGDPEIAKKLRRFQAAEFAVKLQNSPEFQQLSEAEAEDIGHALIFIAENPEYLPTERNGAVIAKYFQLKNLPLTRDNLEQAFVDLKAAGFLETFDVPEVPETQRSNAADEFQITEDELRTAPLDEVRARLNNRGRVMRQREFDEARVAESTRKRAAMGMEDVLD